MKSLASKYAVRSRGEVARIMGCTRQNVECLEKSAFRKLRRWLRAKALMNDVR